MQNGSNAPVLKLFAVAALIFLTTLAVLYAIGFVPDYVDGTADANMAARAEEASVPQLEGLPGQTYLVPLSQLLVPVAPVAVLPEAIPPVQNSAAPQTPVTQTSAETPTAQTSASSALPTRIVIPKIGKNLPINNPSETDVTALDNSLLSGVVRYPLSAKLNQTGTIFIFGHSSHLPVVQNKMFQAFNDLETLKVGDAVKVQGGGRTYMYSVTTVRKADATEDYVDLESHGEQRLILSTCDSFGKKTTRWIVEAKLSSVE
jgi:LPXTG-site transpeptidase (sortase) family protein